MKTKPSTRHEAADASRRAFVQALAQGGLGAAFLMLAGTAQAQERNAAAFNARALPAVYKALGIEPGAAASPAIKLTAPDVAENGANVPIDVAIHLPAVERIVVIGEKNAFPLLLDVAWSTPGPVAFDVRIKLGETANVRVIAVSGGQVHTVAREVKVTQGGCAG